MVVSLVFKIDVKPERNSVILEPNIVYHVVHTMPTVSQRDIYQTALYTVKVNFPI